MIAQHLKSETAPAHAAAERYLSQKLHTISSKEDYGLILRSLYGFYAPLQDAIFQQINTAHLGDVSARRSASLILDDLSALGFSTENIEVCTQLPVVRNVQQAFGALYVLEGSTLGGRMISRMLKANHHIQLQPAQIRFFEGYQKDTGEKWKSFLEALNQQTDVSPIIETANQTFQLFQNWIIRSIYYERTC